MKMLLMLMAVVALAACDKKVRPAAEADQRQQQMSVSLDRSAGKLRELKKAHEIKDKEIAVRGRMLGMQKLNLEIDSLRVAYEASGRTAEDRRALQARLDEIKLKHARLQSESAP